MEFQKKYKNHKKESNGNSRNKKKMRELKNAFDRHIIDSIQPRKNQGTQRQSNRNYSDVNTKRKRV